MEKIENLLVNGINFFKSIELVHEKTIISFYKFFKFIEAIIADRFYASIGFTENCQIIINDKAYQFINTDTSMFYNNQQGMWELLGSNLELKYIRINIYQDENSSNKQIKRALYTNVEMLVTNVKDGILTGIIKPEPHGVVGIKNVKVQQITLHCGSTVVTVGLVGNFEDYTEVPANEMRCYETSIETLNYFNADNSTSGTHYVTDIVNNLMG